jgi:hypothetical protein
MPNYYHCPHCAFSAGHAERCPHYKRYAVKRSRGLAEHDLVDTNYTFVLIDFATGNPIYQTDNEAKVRADCEKLNKAWTLLQGAIR